MEDRAALAHRIGKAPEFPPIGYKGEVALYTMPHGQVRVNWSSC